MENMIQGLFSLSEKIRYAALYQKGKLISETRGQFDNASDSESDKYEEILVNPAILLLAKQRGEIDCGGVHYILVRYGNFYQWVRPLEEGHLSVCIQPTEDILTIVDNINQYLSEKA